MKVAVSTIAKNEAKNVEAFIASCREADVISVLDTGSTDETQELLKTHGAFAGEATFSPFRFDTARNRALELLPEDVDVVVSIDMDERLQPGWRQALERAWRPEVMDALSYWYIAEWQDAEKTVPAVPSWRTKIFKRRGFKWFRPVHEIPLLEDGSYPRGGMCREIEVRHYQSGERNYEPLLTELLKENPNDEDAWMQRGAEWMRLQEFKKAIGDYEKYLSLTAVRECKNPLCDRCQLVAGRRAYCHIGIAQAKHILGYAPGIIVEHFLKAVGECPSLREAWTYLADGLFATGNFAGAYGAAVTALSITDNGIHSMDMRCWGEFPKELADNALARILAGEPRKKIPLDITGARVGLGLAPRSARAGEYPAGPPRRIGQPIADEHLAAYFGELVGRIANIPGDVIECGVCHGYSFTQLALALYRSGTKRTLYGLDSWSEMSPLGPEDHSVARAQAMGEDEARFKGAGVQGTQEEVRQRLVAAGIPREWVAQNVVLIEGWIEKTLPELKGKTFALAHVDVDTYASYKAALPYLWPSLQRGGVMALDEYGDPWWPGANKAVNEYFATRTGEFRFEGAAVGQTGRYIVVKL